MTDLTTTYDPCAEAEQAKQRAEYHRTQAEKYASWAGAAMAARTHLTSPVYAQNLTACVEHCASMATYHHGQHKETHQQWAEALARCTDLELKRVAALRAAADAADMAGDRELAMELNRRAARAEGYDPDEDEADAAWDDEPTGDTQDLSEPEPCTTRPAEDGDPWADDNDAT